MKFEETRLKGAYEIIPTPFVDERGSFARLYCKNEFASIGHSKELVQINYSTNHKKGTLRGLHYQKPPYTEVKIIRCIRGAIMDIIVDLRKNSLTYLQHIQVELSDRNQKALYVPEGFGHGFITLEDNSELIYYSTEFFNPKADSGVNYSDPRFGITLPIELKVISEKDKNLPFLEPEFAGLEL
jgi:dTDP-4-dehydrorhamnose 3,5-epimerase